jgi:N-acetyl-anhydromuramyl-L-alanine amidase AmpD
MSVTIIVDKGSPVLDDPTTQILHRYANGEVLVEAKDGSSGQPVSTGVVLDGKTVEDERDTLDKVGPNERIAAYVELAGPAESEMLDQLRKVGVTPQQFVPQSTYLSTGTGNALRAGRALAFVQGVVPLNKGLKEGFAAAEDDRQMMATVVASAALIDGPALEALVKATPDAVVDGDPEPVGSFLLLPVRLTAPAQTALLADSRILRVESREPKVIEDEVADLILVGSITDDGKPSGSYTKWLDDHAVNGSGVTIGIVDQGVDTSHPAFTGRISDLASGAKDWHGTFVAGHAAGAYMEHKDKDGFIYGVGMAPQAEILVQNNQNDATTLCNETVTSQGPSGNAGSIQNNSWGAGNKDPMDYQAMEASYDGLVRNALSASGTDSPLTICFSVGNDGTKGITRPHGAKNLIVTGNSENYRPDIGGADSDNVREIYSGAHASSHGNCGDGRIRPLVAAPGEWTASANYDSHPGEQEYVDDMITWGGGSSGASPKTAGACALLTEWWRSHDGNASPSPAMLRALVINGATPIDSGGEIPNMIQGWGRLNLDNIVRDDVHRSYVDQSILLTSRGDLRTWTIRPSDQTKPLWITLTWTDPPGAPGTGTSSSPAVVNKLAVRAKTKETQYRANQFSGGWSEPDKGDANEGWDNNQCIYLSADALGDTVEVSVTALELGMNCLTNQADTPQQDFALVIRGGYVDQGACPADVFLIIDGGAASPASSDGDHWASGSSDAGEVSDPAPAGDASDTGDAGTTDGGSGDAGAADGGTPDSGSADSGSTGSGDGGDAWWGEGDQPATETTKKNVVPPVVHAGASAGVSIADADPSTNVHGDATKPVADLGQALAAVDATWADHDATRRRAAVLVVGDATHVSNADVAVMRRLSFRGELWVLSTTQSILAFLAQRVHRRTGVHYRLCQDANDLAGGIRDALVEAAGFQRLTVRRAAADPTSPTATFEVVPDDDLVAVRVQLSDPQNAQIRVEGVKGAGTYVQPGAAGYVERSGADWRELRFQMDSFSPGAWTVHVNLKKARPVGVEVYARTRLGMSVHHDHTPDGPLVAAHGGERGRVGRMQFNPPAVAGDVVATPTTEAQRPIQVVSETSRIDSGGKVAEAPREMPAPTLGIVIPAPPTVEGARVVDLVGSVHGVVDSGHRFGRVVRRSIIDLEPRSLWRARLRPDLLVRTYAHVDDVVDHPDRVTALTLRRNGHSRKVWVRAPYLQRALRSLDLHDPDLLFEVRGPALVGVVRPVGHEKLLAAAGRVPASAGSGSLFSLADLEPAGPAVEDTKSNTDYASVVQFVPAKWFQAMPSGRAIKRVVIHITDGGALAKNTAAYFADPKDKNGNPVKASAHYVVGQAGEIYQCVREKDIAWHAGPSGNSDTIGIEHNARSAKELNKTDPGLPLTQVQYAASVALVKDICTRYKIPLDRAHIIGHNEADPKNPHPDCPTGQWDWTYFMNQLLTPAPATGGAAGAMSNGGAGASDASGGAGTGQPAGSPTGGGTPSGGTPDASGTDGTTDTSGDSTDASGSMDTSDSTDTTDTADSTDTSDSTDTADSTDTSGSDTTDTSGTGDDATDASSGGGDDTTDASGSDGIDDTGDVTDTSGSSDTGDTSDTSDTGDTTDISGSDGSGDMGGSSDTGTDDSGSADPGTTDGGDESFDSGSGDEPVVEIQRVLLRAGPPDPVDRRSVLVIARPIVKPIAVADGDGINRRILRPVWVGGLVPYLPTTPTPQLASPVAIGDFLIWPNAAERQGLYTLAAPHLRNVTLLVDRANVDVDGGTTTKITGGTAIITVSSYSDVTADELAALQADWA